MDVLTRAQIFESTRRLSQDIRDLTRFTQNPFDEDLFSDEALVDMCSSAQREFNKRRKELQNLEVQTIGLLEAERVRRIIAKSTSV